jgi:hypothetical protein
MIGTPAELQSGFSSETKTRRISRPEFTFSCVGSASAAAQHNAAQMPNAAAKRRGNAIFTVPSSKMQKIAPAGGDSANASRAARSARSLLSQPAKIHFGSDPRNALRAFRESGVEFELRRNRSVDAGARAIK